MAKINIITITEQEKTLLKEYAKAAPLILLRFKAQAILLFAQGVAAEVIADYTDKTPRTVSSKCKWTSGLC